MKQWSCLGAALAGCWRPAPVAALSVAALASAVCAGAAPAAAQAPGATATGARVLDWLDWEAPAGCPERGRVYARTREAVGFAPEQGRFQRVRGVIVPAQQGYLLTLEFFEGEAQRSRSIEAKDCGDLEGAAAIAVALALGNEAPSAPVAPALDEQDVPRAPPSSEPEPAARTLGWGWSLAGLLDLESVSQPSWGVGADVRARWDALELGLLGLWIPAAQQDVSAGESVQFGLVAAGPLVCWRWSVPLNPAACAALEVGQLSADGTGLSQNVQQFSAWWVAPSLALELQQALTQAWALQLSGEVLRPLLRERYTVNGNQTVYESPEAVFRLYLGISWSLD